MIPFGPAFAFIHKHTHTGTIWGILGSRIDKPRDMEMVVRSWGAVNLGWAGHALGVRPYLLYCAVHYKQPTTLLRCQFLPL